MYELPQAKTEPGGPEALANTTEQALIAFFGLDNLLNRQAGGKGSSLTCDAEDKTLFTDFRANTYTLLQERTFVATQSVHAAIDEYIQSLKSYKNPSSRKGDDELKENITITIRAQSMPRITRTSRTPLLIVGINPTEEAFKAFQGFFDSTCPTASVVKITVNRMVA